MQYTTLFFDLDDTLYPSSTGLWQAIRERMSIYMAERLGLAQDEIPQLRRHYFEIYGTTLRGLQIHHHVDADDYLAFVHDVPLTNFLQPRPELRTLLLSLPQPCWIFTNADERHASRVLKILGLTDCFTGIIDVCSIGFACKPEELAFRRALALANENNPHKCILIDDSLRNLAGAQKLGFTTVLIDENGNHSNPKDPNSPHLKESPPSISTCQADYRVSSLFDLPEILPILWQTTSG